MEQMIRNTLAHFIVCRKRLTSVFGTKEDRPSPTYAFEITKHHLGAYLYAHAQVVCSLMRPAQSEGSVHVRLILRRRTQSAGAQATPLSCRQPSLVCSFCSYEQGVSLGLVKLSDVRARYNPVPHLGRRRTQVKYSTQLLPRTPFASPCLGGPSQLRGMHGCNAHQQRSLVVQVAKSVSRRPTIT